MRSRGFGAVALLVIAGCQVWREQPLTVLGPVTVSRPLRVTVDSGARRLTLERATVRADSVLGSLTAASVRRGDDWVRDTSTVPGSRVAIAAADVWALEEGRTSWRRAVVLLAAVGAVAAVALYYTWLLIVLSGEDQ